MDYQALRQATVALKELFESKFQQNLSPRLLAGILAEDIRRKQQDFFRSQLSSLEIEPQDFLTFFSTFETSSPQEKGEQRRRGRKSFLSPSERLERRKAYAKKYYESRRKKETASELRKPFLGPKAYKTTEEQRQYQKQYYQRKKDQLLEALRMATTSQDVRPLLSQEDETLPKVKLRKHKAEPLVQ